MSDKVTKNDLIDAVYKNTNCDRQTVQNVMENLIKEIKESLEAGKKIELRGFGTFEPRLRKGKKKARNPKTGKILSVAPHYVAAFRAGQSLHDNLWNLNTDETTE